jgi:fibronectin type 3 domain-containing protein
MRRIFVALCLIVSTGGCVNLSKPEKVADCATKGNCVNAPKVLDAGGPDTDANSFIEGQKKADADTAAQVPDGQQTPDDAPIGNGPDTEPNVSPDLPEDPAAMTGDEPGAIGQPDGGPQIQPDQAADTTPGGSEAGGPGPETPIITNPDGGRDQAPDAPADLPPDTTPDTKDAYRDVAVGICAPGGVIQPAGTVCRAAVGACDVDETCDGVTADCPADKLAVAGTSCRAVAGDCDIAETCTGTSPNCPTDGFKQAGTVCRAAAGACDVAESCTGTSAACPDDTLAASTTVCRTSTDSNKCDPAESCTGSSVSCPNDLIYTRPAAPSAPSATSGTNQVSLAWTAAAGATGYNVKRSTTSGSGYTTLGSAPTTSTSPYVDSGIAAGTYYYVVSSINTVTTCESANSTQVTANPVGPCTPPAAPAVTGTSGNNTVVLTWPAVAGAVSYTVARSQTSGTGYATLGTPTPANGTTYTDSQVLNGNTYYYVVTASNGTCSSGNSAEVSASPACTPPNVPAAPTATATMTSVTLNWTAPAGATTYQIKRSTTSGTGYVPLQNVSVTTFTDTTVVTGTTYYYVIAASNGFCSSADSPQVSVTPTCIPPSAPTVTATPSNNQVSLSWTAPQGATSYAVYRGTTSGGESATAIATPTTTNYVDNSAVNGTTYYYVVKASNGSCASVSSVEVSATPVCTPPGVPGTLTATAGDGQVSLSWGASTPAPTSYTVQRKTGAGGTYATIATPAVTSYTDVGLTNGTTYYYKVSAYNGTCSSNFNTEASAIPQAVCSQTKPGSPAATPSGSVQVTVTWTASTPTPTSYSIGRSATSGSGYVTIGSVAGTVLTYTDTDTSLVKNTAYYYQITAVGTVCTATSNEVSATTACAAPAAPGTPTVTNSSGALTVTWSTVSGATAYTVYRSTSSGGTYSSVSNNQTAATFTDPAAGLNNGTVYYYKVSASNANAQCASAQSGASSGTRSCTIPTAPTGLSAKRSGNKQVTLVWTNSPGTNNYSIQRSTTSGSGYSQVGTATGTTYTDTVPSNTAAYYYVVTARSDAGGYCSSGNSAQVSVPVCSEYTGGGSSQKQNDTSEWCLVTCDDVQWWGFSNGGDRTLYINTAQTGTSGAMPLPPKGNSGYAFYFTASANGSGNYTYWNYGSSANHGCP